MSTNYRFTDLTSSQKATLKMLGLVFAEEKSAIQLLTLTTSAEAIFKLRDEDWARISGLKLSYRELFEQSIREDWSRFETLWNES